MPAGGEIEVDGAKLERRGVVVIVRVVLIVGEAENDDVVAILSDGKVCLGVEKLLRRLSTLAKLSWHKTTRRKKDSRMALVWSGHTRSPRMNPPLSRFGRAPDLAVATPALLLLPKQLLSKQPPFLDG